MNGIVIGSALVLASLWSLVEGVWSRHRDGARARVELRALRRELAVLRGEANARTEVDR